MEEVEIALETGASLLAAIDARAYNRALIQDANSLFQQIVFPQSFPWCHRVDSPPANLPCDIDEMHSVRKAGDDVTEEHGAFSKPRRRDLVPDNVRARAFRSGDKGVVKLVTMELPSRAQRCPLPKKRKRRNSLFGISIPGELALRSFEEAAASKRQKLQGETRHKRTRLLSIRFASTSSRTSIFNGQVKNPLLLPAQLPLEVQQGRREVLSHSKAVHLGSYDCRHGLAAGTSSHKTHVSGRTRKVWTKKLGEARFIYKSILDGKRLENGSQKRPRNVKMGIRLNGKLLSSEDERFIDYDERLSEWVANQNIGSDLIDPYSDRIIAKSIQDTFAEPDELLVEKATCSIDHAGLVATALGSHSRTIKEGLSEANVEDIVLVKPPLMDCLPGGDGQFRCVCTNTGSIKCSNTLALSRLMDQAAHSRKLCMVCWSEAPDVVSCRACGLLVHPGCHGGQLAPGDLCPPCVGISHKDTDSRERRLGTVCSMCPFRGGSITKYGQAWSHTLCRSWVSNAPPERGSCSVCSDSVRPLIKCAAKGCQIKFHPMCAIVSSLMAHKTMERNGVCEPTSDEYLSSMYTMTMIETSTTLNGEIHNARLPVAFCGLHNQKRQADFYGLPPKGGYVSQAVRVPPSRP